MPIGRVFTGTSRWKATLVARSCWLSQTWSVPSIAPQIHPALSALENAPIDDEPTTDEDLAAIEAARLERLSDKPMSTLEEVAKELGIEL